MAERTMYTCQLCKQVTPPRTKAHRIVLETRSRSYQNSLVHKLFPETVAYSGSRFNTYGHETVREIIACPTCAAAYNLPKDKG